ncbi:MAG: aspartate ammonia-lyase [Promethearchaeota archaeon]
MRRLRKRIEKDSLGEKEVPYDVYYGIQTLRALENFPVTGLRAHPNFIKAYVMVKKAAALANMKLRVLKENVGKAILKACDEILSENLIDQFVVDVFQAGAGTSFNMNVNEVIANRALEISGQEKGKYDLISPNDDVNRSQSTNDTFPTASHVAILISLDKLVSALVHLQDVFESKAEEFKSVLKSGRTHLQDAVPLTLGQEFKAYATAIKRQISHINERKRDIEEVALGGTAVGVGTNAPEGYQEEVIQRLREISNLNVRKPLDLREALQSHAKMAAFSSSLKELSLELIRIANDLRLLDSGPASGINEIKLPAVQPGSSIMPGKVNPVMAECLNMICFQIVGNDLAVGMAVQAGQIDLNVMTPVIIHNILQSMTMLSNYLPVFADKCVKGIGVNIEKATETLHRNAAIATLLTPYIGYLEAAKVVKESLATGKTIVELVKEKGLLSPEKIKRIFDYKRYLED